MNGVKKGLVRGLFVGLLAVACATANDLQDNTANVVLQWNDAAVTAIRREAIPPTVGARILAVMHAAMYDAWAAYDPVAVPSIAGGPPRQPANAQTSLNKDSAISYAAYRVLMELIPAQKAFFNEIMIVNIAYDPSITTTNPTSSPGVGNAAAAAQMAFRRSDGANQTGSAGGSAYSDYTGYTPVNTPDLVTDPNHWQPLRDAKGNVQEFLTPHWGKVAPFALKAADQFRPPAPPQAGNWLYQQRLRDTLQQSAVLDEMDRLRANYWADTVGSETSPGHWNRIAEEISARDLHTLDTDVKLFFVLNQAILDASISVWEAKRFFDSIRPVSVVRYYYAGDMLPGSPWTPAITTPAYPEYPSDNAAFAHAAAEVLKRFKGNDVYFKQAKVAAASGLPEMTLGWFTFSQMADDAERAGKLGATQFADAGLQGGLMGRGVGSQVWEQYARLLAGSR